MMSLIVDSGINSESLQTIIGDGNYNISVSKTILTRPNVNLKTSVRDLSIIGSGGRPTIKRPNNSIGSVGVTDFNYGLFLIPTQPTADELDQIPQWYENDEGILYAVLIRGDILFKDITIDCNMGHQDNTYPGMPGSDIEHSAMIGFSGQSYTVSYGGSDRKVLTSFNSVKFDNVGLLNGGFADDIWCNRGYFRPNVNLLTLDNVENLGRVNTKRASVGFSGLAKTINITNCDLYKLEAETDEWGTYPEQEPDVPVTVNINNLTVTRLDWATKSQSSNIYADNIYVEDDAFFYQCGGLIQNSNLILSEEDGRFHRMNNMEFRDCTYRFKYSHGSIVMRQIDIWPEYGIDSNITFTRVNFVCAVPGSAQVNTLIITDDRNDGNVNADFIDCTYDSRFNSIAFLRNPGIYNFTGGGVNSSNVVKSGQYVDSITLNIS